MEFSPKLVALVFSCVSCAAGCSSSSDTSATGPTPIGDSSTASDAGGATDSAMATDAKPSTAPCHYAVSGDRTYADQGTVSCPGYLKQVAGMGDYTINVAAGIGTTAKSNLTFGFAVSCPVAPKAGDVWTMGKDGCTGDLSLTEQMGSTGTIWSISNNATPAQKSETKITFGNVTKTTGTQRPEDVYYLFDITLETTLILQPGGSTTVKVTGKFAASALPIGT